LNSCLIAAWDRHRNYPLILTLRTLTWGAARVQLRQADRDAGFPGTANGRIET
jgi:hypothetical protein